MKVSEQLELDYNLKKHDNGKNRKISESSEKDIKTFISNSDGWDVDD